MDIKKLLPWPLLSGFGALMIPIASQFTPTEVWEKLGTWKWITGGALSVIFAIGLIRAIFTKDAYQPARPPSAHDIELFQRITSVLNDAALTFLVDHDFHNDCHVRQLEPISNISYWHGPNYMFGDEVIQRRWQALFTKILKLSDVYGDNLVNASDNINRMTAWHHGFPRNAQPPQAHEEIAELNQAMANVYTEFGDFALFVRKRLGL